MRLISPLGLKQSIAVNAILETGKCLEDIIDDEPSVDPVHVAGGATAGNAHMPPDRETTSSTVTILSVT